MSGKDIQYRPQFQTMLDFLREEDERLNQLMQDLFISILGYVSETERKKIKERHNVKELN